LLLSLIVRLIPFINFGVPWSHNLHHVAYGQYIVETGRLFEYLPQMPTATYQFWPCSHLLISIIHVFAGIDIIIIYHGLCILSACLSVTVFFLIMKNVVGNLQLAILSSLILGLFPVFIIFGTYVLAQNLARMFTLFILYILLQRKKVLEVKVTLLLLIFASIASHHLEIITFIFSLSFIWIFGLFFKEESITLKSKTILLMSIVYISWWIYVVSSSYFSGTFGPVIQSFLSTVKEGFILSSFWPQGAGSTLSQSVYFSQMKRLYYFVFFTIGSGGVGLISTMYLNNRNSKCRKLFFVIPWFLSILLMGFPFILISNKESIPMSSYRIIELLYIPLCITFSLFFKYLYGKTKTNWIKNGVTFFFMVLIVLGGVLAYPMEVYNGDMNPRVTTYSDKESAFWIQKYTSVNSVVLGDNHISQAILFWGKRQGFWGDNVKQAFNVNTLPDLLNIKYFNYVGVNNYNRKFKFYNEWGNYFPISENSFIRKIDDDREFAKIFDNGDVNFFKKG
jgi:uncharacterized membrane protein